MPELDSLTRSHVKIHFMVKVYNLLPRLLHFVFFKFLKLTSTPQNLAYTYTYDLMGDLIRLQRPFGPHIASSNFQAHS